MNNKLTKIWGVGLVLVLLVSMFGLAVPASAGTLSWTIKANADVPSITNEILATNSDLIDMAVSSDGETIYVAANITAGDKIFKSINGGDTWTEVALPSALTNLTRIAIAPDDTDIVVIQGDTTEVYASTNAGSTFSTLGTVTGDDGAITAIYDLAVSAMSGSSRMVAVAGTGTGANNAMLMYFNLGHSAPVWKDAISADFTGSEPSANATLDKIRAVAFSPNFASDQVILAVSEETGGALDATGYIRYHIASFNQLAWDASVFSSYPVTLESATDNTTLLAGYADITVDPAFLGGDDSTRIAFVGASVTSGGTEIGGIYRLKNTTLRQEKTGVGIFSVAWDGVNIAGGASADNNVYRSADALVSSPTYSTSRGNKEIGVDDSGTDATTIRWAGDTLVGVKSGEGSSFSRSTDNGKTWNEIALVDTALTTMLDFDVAADGSEQYLLTSDSAAISLWRAKDSNFQRIFVIQTDATDWIVRAALADPDTVYIGDVGGTTIYYTNDGGLEKWTQRTSRYTIADIAAQDADVAYVANQSNDEVSKTTNGGFTWGADKDTLTVGGVSKTLNLISEDNLLIGTTTGYVAYSSDGNDSWTKVATQLNGTTNAHVTASGLAEGDFIYASTTAAATRVERWEIGQSSTFWKNLSAATPATYGSYGIALVEGTLFSLSSNSTEASLEKTLSPTTSTPSSAYWMSVASADESFNKTPTALKISTSGNDVTLWAIDNVAEGLWSFTDTLATAVPVTLISPADDYQNPINPVSGLSQDISFSWNRPSAGTTSLAYEVKVYASDGTSLMLTATKAATALPSPNVLIGPNQSTNTLTWAVGETYFWKVRVSSPVYSPYSEKRSFTIQPLTATGINAPLPLSGLLAPVNGSSDSSRTPSFSWAPVAGVTDYNFVLANNASLKAPIVDVVVKGSTAYAITTLPLNYGVTYFWAVTPVAPIAGTRSAIGNFTVGTEPPPPPAPPVVVQQVPAPVLNIPAPPPAQQIIIPPAPPAPAPITPAYIWAVIIIGAVLVIAVIILIVRTRRAV